jgi:hypothetical protein
MTNIGWFEIGDLRLRKEPERDSCFRLVRNELEMEDSRDASDAGWRK